MRCTRLPLLWTCRYPFLYITVSFIAGIITARHTIATTGHIPYTIFFSLVLVYILLIGWGHLRKKTLPYLGLFGLMGIFCAGYITLHNTHPICDPHHLIHTAPTIQAYIGRVTTFPTIKQQMKHTTLKLRHIRTQGAWKPASGKVSLRWAKDELPSLAYGDMVMVLGAPKEAICRINDTMFNYREFLASQNIYHTHFIHSGDLQKLSSLPDYSLLRQAMLIRSWLVRKIEENISASASRGLVLALMLGIREELNEELQTTYIRSGIIHVLAISGLHVGLLYMLLRILLRLFRLHHGFIGKVLSLFILWSYAWITGLAPAVVRAVTMFSLFIVSKMLKRSYQSTNTLVSSAFFLTLYNPHLTFQPGFQLSYIAVFGILWLQPKLYACSKPPKWAKSIVQLITLSLSAQLVTLPLTLYYFHAFPTYFLPANLIAIPAISLILVLTLLILLTSSLPAISLFLGDIITYCTTILHHLLRYIPHLPGSKITDIYLSLTTVILLYTTGALIWLFFYQRKFIYLPIATWIPLLLTIKGIYSTITPRNQWLYYDHPTHSAIIFMHNDYATVFNPKEKEWMSSSEDLFFYLQKQGIKQTNTLYPFTSSHQLKLIVLQGKRGIWIDRPLPCFLETHHPIPIDLLVIANNAVHNLKRILSCFRPEIIILASTNRPQVCQKLHTQAQEQELACWVAQPLSVSPIKIP